MEYRFFPHLLYYIAMPVRKNVALLQPSTSSGRLPVMIFSHGLGGTRNAYSQLAGSLASHGVIVIAPEHRDGSTPISYIRDTPSDTSSNEKAPSKHGKRTITYHRLSHTPSPEVEAGRNEQLKIRLWEMGLIHDSLLKLDQGQTLTNLNTSAASLSMFKSQMDVHEPGKIIFAGHSFGAVTVTQFVKSTFYSPQTSSAPKEYQPLFAPSSRSSIATQITPQTAVILLDIWCLPLRAPSTRWLWEKPFPCYTPSGAGGSALLAVESQAFFKWRVHLKSTKRLLSPDPTSDVYNYSTKNGQFTEPNFYYSTSSAHLNQSDFGILFPWVTKQVFSAEEPDRILRLNIRAILQLLRSCGVEVSATSTADMEIGSQKSESLDDKLIFGKNGEVRGWNWLSTDVADLGDVDDEAEAGGIKGEKPQQKDSELSGMTEPSNAVLGNELMKQKEGPAERL